MKTRISFITIVILFLAACSTLDMAVETAPGTQTAQARLQTATQESTDLDRPPPASAGMLPAPFYFISQGQIWRGESDGQILKQITHETEEIVGMDVSSLDGALAYVSANQLIVADAGGNNRRVLTQGIPPQSTQDVVYRMKHYMSSPAWSPDGQRLAYGLDGVNVINLSDGQIVHLIDNPEPPTGGVDMVTTYLPRSWTLDGERLFVRRSASCELLPVATRDATSVASWGGDCDITWSNDRQSVFAADLGSEYTTFGVWQIDVETGAVKELLSENEAFDWTTSAAFPKQSPDGRLFFFYRAAGDETETMFVAAPLNDLTQMNSLRPIELPANIFWSEALWAPDASLVIIAIYNGSMHILPTDDTPMITLPVYDASDLRWGVN